MSASSGEDAARALAQGAFVFARRLRDVVAVAGPDTDLGGHTGKQRVRIRDGHRGMTELPLPR